MTSKMLKIGDWEIYFRKRVSEWSGEDRPHSWEFGMEFKWLSPFEKKHRADWEKSHPGLRYPTY